MPPVSIGVPVYNGANFLEESLCSLLAQTYGDFELIISDNASTDETREICESFMADDPRIRYVRQEKNLGAAANYNKVFQLSRGKYFKWATHDDLISPTYLDKCVSVLDQREEIVLVFTLCQEIDEKGIVRHQYVSQEEVDTPNRLKRFQAIAVGYQPFVPVFGLIRRDVLKRTKLIGKYAGSDRTLIAELALRGRWCQIQEPLFQYRVHPDQSWGRDKSHREQNAWYDPQLVGRLTFPHWRLLFEHEHSIWRVPMRSIERVQMQGVMLWWMRTRWRALLAEISSSTSPH